METFGNQIVSKLCHKFYCKYCDYGTSKKSSYNNHNLSAKHKKSINRNILSISETTGINIMPKLCFPTHSCKSCNKNFNNRSGLWKHNKICKIEENNNINKSVEPTDKDLIMMVIKQNTELIKENSDLKTIMMEQTTMMMKVLENGTTNNINTTTNSHNKTFNLNFFLNETCKDAMNITEFIESIKLRLTDLERVGELGYIEGISNIIVKNLKDLDVTKRPVHCTDKKRETMYIKDEDKWEKDEEQRKMRTMIRKVSVKNARMLPKFKEVHPDCIISTSRFSDQYNNIIMEAMGGMGDNDIEKEEKIIKKVSKEVMVGKDFL